MHQESAPTINSAVTHPSEGGRPTIVSAQDFNLATVQGPNLSTHFNIDVDAISRECAKFLTRHNADYTLWRMAPAVGALIFLEYPLIRSMYAGDIGLSGLIPSAVVGCYVLNQIMKCTRQIFDIPRTKVGSYDNALRGLESDIRKGTASTSEIDSMSSRYESILANATRPKDLIRAILGQALIAQICSFEKSGELAINAIHAANRLREKGLECWTLAPFIERLASAAPAERAAAVQVIKRLIETLGTRTKYGVDKYYKIELAELLIKLRDNFKPAEQYALFRAVKTILPADHATSQNLQEIGDDLAGEFGWQDL